MFRRGDNGQHTLLLNVYVDDCTLAGGSIVIQLEFWQEFRQKVRLEPEEYISEKRTKILGRLHSVSRTPKQITMTMTYDMRSYAQGIVDLYCELSGTLQEKLKSAPPTPCLPELSVSDAGFMREGVLHKHAARILMRCLWLSRLARPLGLICYLTSTRNHVFRASVDPNEKPELLVFADSDFASCPHTCRSTSGVIYVIRTGEAYFPILWSSRKQGSTARSTTEAELIAFASALFGEALNLHAMAEYITDMAVPVRFESCNHSHSLWIQRKTAPSC